MPITISQVKSVLHSRGLRLKKGLGQCLLLDPHPLEEIAKACELTKDDVILEIGTGTGALTEYLAKYAGNVISFDVDKTIQSVARELLKKYPNIGYILGDVLEMDLMPFFHNFPGRSVKMAGNLPYYITTPLMMKFLEEKYPFERLVITIQKEVADRILSAPGTKDYGILTLSVSYYCKVERVREISRKAFLPAPDVDSTVLRLFRHPEPPVKVPDEKIFFNLIKASFQQRRKKLSNSLESFANSRGINKSRMNQILVASGLSSDIRAEQLTLEDYARIARNLVITRSI
jgi:16S rRNA (adenine1518-N6/adenine1519-N6)-dimethyltransferase